MPFLLSVIIKIITRFSCFKLNFDLYGCLISSVLSATYKIFRAILSHIGESIYDLPLFKLILLR